MFKAIDKAVIAAANRISRKAEAFGKDERGVSNIVATVILILIVVTLAAIFWKNLSSWFNTLWSQITGTQIISQ